MQSTLRTCHILSRPISTATATMQFIKAEVEAGLKPFVICPAGPPTFLDAYPEVTLLELPIAAISRFAPGQSLHLVNSVLDILQGRTFDVVVVYMFRLCGLLPTLGKKVSKTWLLNIRNSNLSSSGWRAIYADKVTGVETRAFSGVIVCDSGIGKRLLGKRNFYVIPNGADLQKFAGGQRVETRKQLGFAETERVIVYIGVMHLRRRPVRMLETFAQVAAAHPEARLLLVGESDGMDDLVRWAQEHQLAERITFTGRVPYEVVQNYVAAADIGFAYYPNLATYDGNIPLKTPELLAAGLPTVATDTPGNRLYIKNEVNALLAEDEPANLAEVMLRLFDEPELTKRLHQNARSSVMDYDWGNLVRCKLLPIYAHYATSVPGIDSTLQ